MLYMPADSLREKHPRNAKQRNPNTIQEVGRHSPCPFSQTSISDWSVRRPCPLPLADSAVCQHTAAQCSAEFGSRGRKSSETNLVPGEKFMLEFSDTSEGHMKVRKGFFANGVKLETIVCKISPCLRHFWSKRKGKKRCS